MNRQIHLYINSQLCLISGGIQSVQALSSSNYVGEWRGNCPCAGCALFLGLVLLSVGYIYMYYCIICLIHALVVTHVVSIICEIHAFDFTRVAI